MKLELSRNLGPVIAQAKNLRRVIADKELGIVQPEILQAIAGEDLDGHEERQDSLRGVIELS